MGNPSRKKHGKNGHRHYVLKNTTEGLKNRGRMMDQIQDDLALVAAGAVVPGVLDEDAPGGGKFYCYTCARHFTDAATLGNHVKTKDHKRAVKEAAQPAYTHADAAAAAGRGGGR